MHFSEPGILYADSHFSAYFAAYFDYGIYLQKNLFESFLKITIKMRRKCPL